MKNKIFGYAIGPIGSGILGLIILPLLTWFYSVEDIGRISMLQVIASFAVFLFCLGLDQAYTREYHESEDKPKIFKQTFLPGFLLITVACLVVYSFDAGNLSFWMYGVSSTYLTTLSLICFILAFCSRFLSLILRMEDRAVAYSMSQLLPKVFFVIFIVTVVIVGAEKDFYSLISAHAISVTIVFVIYGWNTRSTWMASIAIKFDWTLQKKLFRFGLPLILGGLASWGLNVMDKLFLRGMSSFEELGIYSVTMSIASVAAVFTGVFNTIWAPMVYRWVVEGIDPKKIDEISEHVLAVFYFIVVLSGLFSWILPYILPERYEAIRYLITLCFIGPLLYTLSETTVIGIAISRKTIYSMFASIGAMLINALLNYLLVPTYGALGASIATAIAFFVFYILRTEFSSLVWRKIPRFKSYKIICMLLLFSSIVGLNSHYYIYFLPLWFLFLLFGILVFRASVELAFKNIKKYVAKI